MELTKQSYMAVNELSRKVGKKSSNSIVSLAERFNNGKLAVKFKCKSSRALVVVELKQTIDIEIRIDGYLIEKTVTSIATSMPNLSQGNHCIEIVGDVAYLDIVRLTIYCEDIILDEEYEVVSYDSINYKVFLRDRNMALYSLDIVTNDNVLQIEEYQAYCSNTYVYSGNTIEVFAYIIDGALYIKENGIVVTIETEGVNSVVLMKELSDNAQYHFYYTKDNVMYCKEKYSTGFASSTGFAYATKVLGYGGSVIMYLTPNNRWMSLEESFDSHVLYKMDSIDYPFKPALRESVDSIEYYPKKDGKFYQDTGYVKALTNADEMAFVNGKAILVWKGKVRIMDEEDVIEC